LLLAPLARKRGVTLAFGESHGGVRALADAVQIQQVFTNLVLNAIQAMSRGVVTATVRRERRRAPERLGGDERSWAVVDIRDEGPGIPPAHLSQLFDPFFTTKAVGEGTGLGLSVAWGIVAEHGGWIEVESEPGQGARFHVFLPDAEA
ncbi:MAG: sensor histidine kinase, partial [Myxococcota bacterium]